MSDAEDFKDSLKRAAAILMDEKIEFAVGGGFACWAYGAPESDHDVDLFLTEEAAYRAQHALADAGMRPVDPPEDWLLKVYDGDVLIDLIFRPTGLPITDEVIERAPYRDVLAMHLRVLRLEDVLTTRLLSFNEHHFDILGTVAIARAVREQVDWDELWERTSSSPFARSFFTLVDGLGVVTRPIARAG